MSEKLVFNDGKTVPFESGTKAFDVVVQLGKDALKDAVGIEVEGKLIDFQAPIQTGGTTKILKLKEDTAEVRKFYRHSMSHVLAQAVKRLYPEAKLAIGPATKDGFYYDFEVTKPFVPEDLEEISAEMKKIIKEKHTFERLELTNEEAKEKVKSEPYKVELLEEILARGENASFYQDGDFVDLCAGPHLRFTNQVKHFQLLDVAGAYWRGDEKNTMLQRIYGTAFLNKEDLEQYLHNLEEAKKRDHRRLGKELNLFSSNPETVGGGLILWHPKGGLVRHLIEKYCKEEHEKSGYDFVYTPHVGRSTLWETSGHLEFYKDSMYAPIDIDGLEYYLKPMNCPFHAEIFSSNLRSYRDLPLRFAEWGTVYRFERSGTLHGLTRVRGFTQDDAHLFCRPDQMPAEIDEVLSFSLGILKDFSFDDFTVYLSTRPEKRVGDEQKWDDAENALRAALERSGVPFEVKDGDGAFYGPKIDICVQDAIEREWQLSTVQFDFNLPDRFDLKYIGEDGNSHRPYMIHRALLGSMERFFGVLLEHFAGAFPVWIAPTQAVVVPVSAKFESYAKGVYEELNKKGFRVEIDQSSNTLNYKIRNAQTQKIPYMLVIGKREETSNEVTVRVRDGSDLGSMSVDSFVDFCNKKINSKEKH